MDMGHVNGFARGAYRQTGDGVAPRNATPRIEDGSARGPYRADGVELPPPPVPGPEGVQVGSLGKLLLAICLPLIVLLATGDPHKAAALATKLVGG
jgi:hypothetical protein